MLLPDGHKLSPTGSRRIDTLFQDESVLEVVAQARQAVAAEPSPRADRQAGGDRDSNVDPENTRSTGATTTWSRKGERTRRMAPSGASMPTRCTMPDDSKVRGGTGA